MHTIDTSKLAYDFLSAQSRSVDWDVARREDDEGVTVHLPEITADVLAEYGSEPEAFDADDWLEDNLESYLTPAQLETFTARAETDEDSLDDWLRANWRYQLSADTIAQVEADMAAAKEEHDEEALEQAVQDFEHSDGWYEWKDSFEPAMTFIWPCNPYRISDQDAATLINELAGSTSLVTITPPDDSSEDETQGIVLTGGGMDLSWDICAAYICCGQIPPVRLLSGLPSFAGHNMSPMAKAILECMDLAADALESRAQRLREDRARFEDRLTK
jgi:hypothetical protein